MAIHTTRFTQRSQAAYRLPLRFARWARSYKRPDGLAVPACASRANDVSELINNPPAGGLLSGVDLGPARRDNFVAEPPPVYWH
jgi:hypothetical protein